MPKPLIANRPPSPRFTVALLRDVPNGARVAAMAVGFDEHTAETAARLNRGERHTLRYSWLTVDREMRAEHDDDTPCIVDNKP